MQEVHISLAAFPGYRTESAAKEAIAPEGGVSLVDEGPFGRLSARHVQLVPQNFGQITEAVCEELMAAFPQSQFRLHANVRVHPRHVFADLSGFDLHREWFAQAARISQVLKAPVYTAHSGKRSEANMEQMLNNARRAADLFGCPVGVEGHYPMRDEMLINSWAEYEQVLEADVPFVVDLSHLHILATQTGERNETLVREMLASEQCVEVHVSDNDGTGDWHGVCERHVWWMDLLSHTNPSATIFSEGNHRKHRDRSRVT